MTLTEICPNPNCRARLQIQLPAPNRFHCPRCNEPVSLGTDRRESGERKSIAGNGLASLSGAVTDVKSSVMPGWMLAVCLLLFFVSGASGLVMVLNYWHLAKGEGRSRGRATQAPFQSNIRLDVSRTGFIANNARVRDGWIHDLSRPGGGRLLVGVEDLPGLRPAVEDLEAMTLSRMDTFFPEGQFNLALRKKEAPALIAGEPSMAAWELEVAVASSAEDKKTESPGRLFGSVAVLARRGYVYWFVDLWPVPNSGEAADCWSGLEWGTDRENWQPTPQRELKLAVAGSSLTLNPDIWRPLEGPEKEAFLKSLEGEPAPGQPKSPLNSEEILQGRKKRQSATDSGLKTNAVLQAVVPTGPLGKPEDWERAWENWRGRQGTLPDGAPAVKLVPMAGQENLYRSTVNGVTEELVLVVPANGGKMAWVASCQFSERSDWAGEFARIRRSVPR